MKNVEAEYLSIVQDLHLKGERWQVFEKSDPYQITGNIESASYQQLPSHENCAQGDPDPLSLNSIELKTWTPATILPLPEDGESWQLQHPQSRKVYALIHFRPRELFLSQFPGLSSEIIFQFRSVNTCSLATWLPNHCDYCSSTALLRHASPVSTIGIVVSRKVSHR